MENDQKSPDMKFSCLLKKVPKEDQEEIMNLSFKIIDCLGECNLQKGWAALLLVEECFKDQIEELVMNNDALFKPKKIEK